MKKRVVLVISMLLLTMIPNLVKADELIEPRGAQCPNCNNMTVNAYPGYATEWEDYEGDQCIHGYSNGYDMGQLRWVYGAYKKCSNCGWKSEQTVKQEGRRVCYGY